MSDLRLLFDINLTDSEELTLSSYQGNKEVNKNSLGVVTVRDTRDLTKEKLKFKKMLKAMINEIFLEYVPLQNQLQAALGILSVLEAQRVKQKLIRIKEIYDQERVKIENANNLNTLVFPDLRALVAAEMNQL